MEYTVWDLPAEEYYRYGIVHEGSSFLSEQWLAMHAKASPVISMDKAHALVDSLNARHGLNVILCHEPDVEKVRCLTNSGPDEFVNGAYDFRTKTIHVVGDDNWRVGIILHEYSHALATHLHKVAGHGAVFTKAYFGLVNEWRKTNA